MATGPDFIPPNMPPSHCVNDACGKPMIPGNAWARGVRKEGYVRHSGHGYCSRCYSRWKRTGDPNHVPKPHSERWITRKRNKAEARPMEEVLEDYAMIRDDVSSIKEAAERMGMSWKTLDKALERARKLGDTRGNAPREQIERAIDRNMPPAMVRAA